AARRRGRPVRRRRTGRPGANQRSRRVQTRAWEDASRAQRTCATNREGFQPFWLQRRRPGGSDFRSVVAESMLLKQQLLILNRTRKRAPNLRTHRSRLEMTVLAVPSGKRCTKISGRPEQDW